MAAQLAALRSDHAPDRATATRAAARAGLVAKGVLYLLVGMLATQVAAGGADADHTGALRAVEERPLGKVLLVVLAAGLAGLALWRLAQAVRGDPHEADGPLERVSVAVRALVYGGLATIAVLLLTGSRQGERSGDDRARETTSTVLEWPAGRWLVAAAGVVLLGIAVHQFVEAVRAGFEDRLDTGDMGAATRRGVAVLGRAGHAARGVVFGLVGIFAVRAAAQYDPQEARGVDGALQELAGTSHGTWLIGIVAAGLAAYGLYCLAEARYRRLPRAR